MCRCPSSRRSRRRRARSATSSSTITSRPPKTPLETAINTLRTANVTDLILDLRYNGGGYLDHRERARVHDRQHHADRRTHVREASCSTTRIRAAIRSPTKSSRRRRSTRRRRDSRARRAGTLPTLNLDRVYILTGPGTCSASESIINGLRGVNVQVYVIGSTTCGKPYGFYPADNCGTTYFSIQFRGENAANFGDYTDGFSPANQPSPRHHRCRAAPWPTISRMPLGDPAEGAHRRGARVPREQQPDLSGRDRRRAAAGVEVILRIRDR